MSVRLLTAELLCLLDDLVLTAQTKPGHAGCPGILLHTSRVDEGTEPGSATNCLVGTSTTGEIVGHTWTAAEGHLPATLLPLQYVTPLRLALSKLITKDTKETHVTDLRRTGDHIVIAEDPDLFGGGYSAQFAYGDLDGWPRGVFQAMASGHLVAPSDMRPVQNRTDFPARRLAPFVTVAGRRSGELSLYRCHQSLNVHVQVGWQYRGLLVPSSGWDTTSGEGGSPDVGVYAADLPPLSTTVVADVKPAPEPVSV
jgi:hypothetical protein